MFGLTPYNRRNNEVSKKDDIWEIGKSIFDSFLNSPFLSAAGGIRADMRENEKEYIVEAEIPGVSKEEIKLDLRDDVLNILVERDEEVREEKDEYIRRERRYGSYSRCFYVENVKSDEVSAKYENGLLTVILPKDRNARVNRHRIDIR